MIEYVAAVAAVVEGQRQLHRREAEEHEYRAYSKNLREFNKVAHQLGHPGKLIKSREEYFRPRREQEAKERRHREIVSELEDVKSELQSLRYMR